MLLISHRIWTVLILALSVQGVLFAQDSIPQTPTDQYTRQYTKDNPLIYEDAWDLWPYCYRSDTSEDMGYNIDLVQMILKRLNIPYVIELKQRADVLKDIKEGKADLTLGMEATFHDDYGYYSQTVTQLFTHSVVWPKGQPQVIRREADLAHHQVMVHAGSYSHHLMEEKGWGNNAIAIDDMKEAILQLSQTGEGMMVWNTASLRWLMRTYHLDNLQIASVNMSDGEYRFISRDKHLLDQIDQELSELRVEGSLVSVQNTWFYPDQQVVLIPSWIWHTLNVAIIATVILIIFIILSYYRERKAIARGKLGTRRLAMVMNVSKMSIWLYDLQEKAFIWIDKEGVPRKSYGDHSFTKRLTGKAYDNVTEAIRQVAEQEKETATVEVSTFAESNPTGGTRIYLIVFSVLRYTDDKPSLIIAAVNDVTEDRERERRTKEQLMRYQSVFDTAMIDMVYYDQDGYITDMNERAQRTLKVNLQDAIEERVNLKTIIDIEGFDFDHFDSVYVTRFLNSHGEVSPIKSRKLKDKMIYDLQVVAVRDEKGQALCIYGTGLDVTEKVNAYRHAQDSTNKLKQAVEKAEKYVRNINYAMGVGGVRLVTYSPDTHMLTIYREYDSIQHRLTQSHCMTFIEESSKHHAMRILNKMDSRTDSPISLEIKTTIHIGRRPMYLQFSFVPTYDSEGHVVSYFGMCRDMSEIKATEQQLEEQTARAQEVENLKNSFLRNMSYEIRTPLNAVVGFAELLEMEDNSLEDEEVFIQQIKDNSAHLLQLINDILFLSRLDANMIEITPQPTDFAVSFDAHCQVGWMGHEKPGVRYIVENRYSQLVVEIDDTNVGRVIEQIVSNAVSHTSEGYVRTRYDYVGDKLIIAIEDSGKGIPPELLNQIYERFAGNGQGTRLGLPICKELVEQMGGTIDIDSTQGDGTTVWISIPCKASLIVRKKDI